MSLGNFYLDDLGSSSVISREGLTDWNRSPGHSPFDLVSGSWQHRTAIAPVPGQVTAATNVGRWRYLDAKPGGQWGKHGKTH